MSARPVALAAALAVLAASCAAPAREPAAGAPPRGFAAVATGLPAPPALATLTAGVVPTPVALDVVRYAAEGAGPDGAAITRTVAAFASPAGALGAYNGWFARYGFPAVAVRVELDLGDAAERYDMGWPPLHAVLVRQGERFVLVEADDALPEPTRAPAMATLAAGGLASPLPTAAP